MTSSIKPGQKKWDAWIGTEGYGWLLAALLLNGLLMLLTTKTTLQNFPLSPDEYVYQISAQLFEEGKLSVPSPEPQKFFDTLNMINLGTYYGKYPPGWPILLSLGNKLGCGWLVNPCCGLLTLVVLFVLARSFFSPAVANITMVLTLACPFFIFNSSCYMPHASCMLFLTLAAFLLLTPDASFMALTGAGALAGFSFLTRPFTAVLFLAPFIAYKAYQAIAKRQNSVIRNLIFGFLPSFILFFGLYLLYDYAQTGSFWREPFEIYNPNDRLGFFDHTFTEYWNRWSYNIMDRSWEWVLWTAGIPVAALLYVWRPRFSNPAYRLGLLLTAPALFLLGGYYFYVGPGPFQYGPRYLYESYALLLIPAALGVLRFRRWAPVVLISIVLFNSVQLMRQTKEFQTIAAEHVKFFAQAHRLTNSIIFVHDKDYLTAVYFTRNGLNFTGTTLLVLDLGDEENHRLMTLYPGRSFYLYNPDQSTPENFFKPYPLHKNSRS